jgi:hypothetical protein
MAALGALALAGCGGGGGGGGSSDVGQPPSGAAPGNSEFQVNTYTELDQNRPAVAALPVSSTANQACAVVIFGDASDFAHPMNEVGHWHYDEQAIDAEGRLVGVQPEPRLAHHTDGVGYIGIAADPGLPGPMRYAATIRYHGSNVFGEPHPHSIFMASVSDAGSDNGGVPIMGTSTADPVMFLPAGLGVQELDIAIDPRGPSYPRFCTFRIVGNGDPTDPNTLPAGIYGRLVNRFGSFLTPVFALSSGGAAATQANARVAFNGSGYLAVWEDGGAVIGRRFSASGEPIGGDVTISEGGGTQPFVEANPSSHDYLVVWTGAEIEGRIVHGDGTAGAVVQLNELTGGAQFEPQCAADTHGNWRVVWTGGDGDGTGIVTRLFDASLAPQGGDFQVNTDTAGNQREPAITFCAANDKWLVVWTGLDEQGTGIRARYIPAGAPVTATSNP